MPDDFAPFELLFAQQDAEQRALAGAVAADEADLHVFGQRHFGIVEQDLAAEALVGVLQLHQHGHSRHILRLLFGHDPGDPTKTGEN